MANSKLGEVDDILSSNNPDYNESDQLDDIQDAIDGKENGNGGNGNDDDVRKRGEC